MLHQLGNRLRLLAGGARDLPERHQTMRAAIDWSYELLSVEEQILFRRLAVFAGGCFLEAVEAICGFDGINVIDVLESLLDKNLIRQSEVKGEPRFWMFETIREYGLERLEASKESQAILPGHAGYYAKLIQQYSTNYDLAKLEIELDNIRSALRWSIESGKAEPSLLIIANF
jgi:predicted ATPase